MWFDNEEDSAGFADRLADAAIAFAAAITVGAVVFLVLAYKNGSLPMRGFA